MQLFYSMSTSLGRASLISLICSHQRCNLIYNQQLGESITLNECVADLTTISGTKNKQVNHAHERSFLEKAQ